jgi:hypothetical protein
MERFKQSIYTLEKEVADLKQSLQSIKGSTPAKSDIHYVSSSQEFGEYSLEELDTFRFRVSKSGNSYTYTLTNPTPELTAYLALQGKTFTTQTIFIEPDTFESYCMEKSGTPFVLTKEIRECLESKLWEYSSRYLHPQGGIEHGVEFATDITIPFKHSYKIPPHISYYITPMPQIDYGINSSVIKEITTKQVVFNITYGSTTYRALGTNVLMYKNTDLSLKLHYSISGIVDSEYSPILLEYPPCYPPTLSAMADVDGRALRVEREDENVSLIDDTPTSDRIGP